jgi:Family of unknown function (DUF6760)
MYACILDRGSPIGGIVSYPLKQLRREVAVLAFHFHWPYETIMAMEHQERRMWVREIAGLLDQ